MYFREDLLEPHDISNRKFNKRDIVTCDMKISLTNQVISGDKFVFDSYNKEDDGVVRGCYIRVINRQFYYLVNESSLTKVEYKKK